MSARSLSEDEEAIARMAGEVVAGRAPLADQQRTAAGGAVALDRALLAEWAGLGFFSQAAPEAAGGLGLSWRASGLVAEAAGAELVPGPWLDQLVAVRVLAGGGEEAVGPVACGDRLVAVAVGAGVDDLVWDGAVLGGTVRGLRFGDEVDRWVVPVPGAVLVVDPGAPGVGRPEAEPTVDPLWRSVGADLDGVVPEAVVPAPPDGPTVALALASLLVSAAEVAAASRVLAIAVEHVRDRTQFGVPVGSFQAVKHRLANARIEVLHAQALVRKALADEEPDGAWAARMAADHCGRAVSEAALQVHGGIGFTSEVPVHLYLKSALQLRAWPEPVDRARARVRAGLGLDGPGSEEAA